MSEESHASGICWENVKTLRPGRNRDIYPHLPANCLRGLRHLLSELRAPYQLLWSSAFLQIRLAQMLLNQLGNGWESIQDSFMISILGFSAAVGVIQPGKCPVCTWRFRPGRSAMFQPRLRKLLERKRRVPDPEPDIRLGSWRLGLVQRAHQQLSRDLGHGDQWIYGPMGSTAWQ